MKAISTQIHHKTEANIFLHNSYFLGMYNKCDDFILSYTLYTSSGTSIFLCNHSQVLYIFSSPLYISLNPAADPSKIPQEKMDMLLDLNIVFKLLASHRLLLSTKRDKDHW
jgi:hypothetical protein